MAPPAAVTKPPETVAKRRMPTKLDQPRRRAFELRRHITVPTTAKSATAAATFGGPAASHEKALAKKPAGAAAAPMRQAVAAARQVAHAAPRAFAAIEGRRLSEPCEK